MSRLSCLVMCMVVIGCTEQAVVTAEASEPLGSTSDQLRAPRLVQPGDDLLLLGVTSDDDVLYQEGQTIYASQLSRRARRLHVADVPGTNIAHSLQVGSVVFIWTNPQRELPGFGVSPLVIWSSAGGARLVSSNSAVGVVATDASPDGRQIVFTTNVAADGVRGDLALAATCEPTPPTILLRDIRLNFPSDLCRPLAGYVGTGAHATLVAASCAGADTTATLSKWVRGQQTDLLTGIATPLPFTLDADPQGEHLLESLADGRVVTVSLAGDVATLDTGVTPPGLRGLLTRRGVAAYTAPVPTVGRELRLARPGQPVVSLGPVRSLYTNGYFYSGGYAKSRATSPDGALALFASTADTALGLTNVKLLDLASGEATLLETDNLATRGTEIFTADSRFALFLDSPDLNNGTAALMAATRHGARQVSTGNQVFDVFHATQSVVTFTQSPTYDPRREFLLSTGDLFVVDVSAPNATPTLISRQAGLFYFPSADRRRVVFTSKTEPEGPGLYVANVRDGR